MKLCSTSWRRRSSCGARSLPEAEAMMAPYSLRLLCLCLAAFFVIHSVAGLVIAASGAAAVRAARRMRARWPGDFCWRCVCCRGAGAVCGGRTLRASYCGWSPKPTRKRWRRLPGAAILAAPCGHLDRSRGARRRPFARHARGCERLGRRSPCMVRTCRCGSWMPGALARPGGRLRLALVISRPVMNALSAAQLAAACATRKRTGFRATI